MNPYECLGVERAATAEEIKKVYRKLARENHPDLNPGDSAAEARFKEISVAYDVLSNEDKRRDYDEFGEVSFQAGFDSDEARNKQEMFRSRFGSPDQATGHGQSFEFSGLDDLLRQFRGGGNSAGAGFDAGGGRPFRGSDVESAMTLEFIEAVRGGEKRLSISRPQASGGLIQEMVTVRIPPGVTDGGKLRIPGKGGEGGGGGPAGDLWIRVRVTDHPVFRRKGRDLTFDLPLTLAEAVVGAKVEVPTLDGRATLVIPPGTSSHARLRLRGKGIPGRSGQPDGDLFARVKIVVPKNLDSELLEALEKAEQENPRQELFQ